MFFIFNIVCYQSSSICSISITLSYLSLQVAPKAEISELNTYTFTEKDLGKAVSVPSKGKGKVAFVGSHAKDLKPRVGVVFLTAVGLNNGTVSHQIPSMHSTSL